MIDQQLRSNDCGISAAKTVCNLLGVEISRELIEDHVVLDQQGASMDSIDRFFKHFGFETRFQLLDVHSIEENEEHVNSLCPFITPVNSNGGLHYWVVEKLRGGKFYVLDPADSRRRKLTLQEFRNQAFFSKSLLDLVELEDVLRAKIGEELHRRSIQLPIATASGKTLADLFNKLNYFQYVQKNFPFREEAVANAYLSDLLLNQDSGAVPRSFRSLNIQKYTVEVEAPVLLSIKKTERTVQPESDAGQQNIYWKLFKSVSGVRDLWTIFVATTVLAAGITYLSVFINQILIDSVLPSYQMNTLTLFAVGVGIFFFFELIFTTFKRYFSIHLGNVFDKYFLSVYDKRLNDFSIRYLQSFRRGDLVERLSDSLKIKYFFMTFFSKIFVNVVVALCSMGILMMISWSLTMMVFVVLLAFAGLFYGLTPHIQRLENQRFARKADFFSRFIEKIEGIQVIKSLQLEHYSSEGIRSNINALVEVQTKSKMLGLLNSVLSSFVTSFASLGIIVLASREMILNNSLSLGMIITFIALSRKIFSAFESLLDYNLDLQENRVILQRFFDFKEQAIDKPTVGGTSSGQRIREFKLENMRLENVNFAYNDDNYVLSGLNIDIWKGEKIWIQGRNGSGKSTFCKVLSFLYPPGSGSIKVNGIDASLYDERRLKSKIAFIASDDLIFNESILFNITFGQPADLREIIRLAKAIDFYEFVESHSEKFDYVLHEKGGNLSTGQRRKLLLLRALMTKADVLILDEIFNGIDGESKFKAEQLLNDIGDRAFIIISHTLIEEINFDQKYKLENGQLLEQTTESVYAN